MLFWVMSPPNITRHSPNQYNAGIKNQLLYDSEEKKEAYYVTGHYN